MSRRTIPGPYKTAQQRRQRVLDFLAANPKSTLPVITAHIRTFGDTSSLDNTMRTMLAFDEVKFEGGHGKRCYSALARTTRTAAAVLAERERKLLDKHFAHADSSLSLHGASHPRGKVHLMGSHPIRNQGGQGCLRSAVHVNCQQFY